jgi:hypothetical protein
MDTTVDRLVTTDVQSGLIVTCGIPLSTLATGSVSNTCHEESILDLSQRTRRTADVEPSKGSFVVIANWTDESVRSNARYNDLVDDHEWNSCLIVNEETKFNVEQSLTDQMQKQLIREDSLSDSSNSHQSKLDWDSSNNKRR